MAGKGLLLVATEASARRLSRSDLLDLDQYSVILNSYSTRSCSRDCHKERVLSELGLQPPRIHQDFLDARLFDLQLASGFPQVQSYPQVYVYDKMCTHLYVYDNVCAYTYMVCAYTYMGTGAVISAGVCQCVASRSKHY